MTIAHNEEYLKKEFSGYVVGEFFNWTAKADIDAAVKQANDMAAGKGGRLYMVILDSFFPVAFLEAFDRDGRENNPYSDDCHGLFVTTEQTNESRIELEFGKFFDLDSFEDEDGED